MMTIGTSFSTGTIEKRVASVATSSISSGAPGQIIKVVPTDRPSVYNLFYTSPHAGFVKVYIYDAAGKKVFNGAEKLKQNQNLKKSYDFSSLPNGIYKIEVIDQDISLSAMVTHALPAIKLDVKLEQLDETGKFKLKVLRDISNPVFVTIYNKQKEVIFQDIIQTKNDFSRVYHLQNISPKDVHFEITCKNEHVIPVINQRVSPQVAAPVQAL